MWLKPGAKGIRAAGYQPSHGFRQALFHRECGGDPVPIVGRECGSLMGSGLFPVAYPSRFQF